MGEQRGSGCGCGTIAMMMLSLAIFALIGSGIYVYHKLPEWGNKAVPYLESKGRALLGVIALEPALNIIERSDLEDKEKKEWHNFMLQKWEIAYKESTSVPREKMINEARGLIHTLPGYYYAFRYIRDERINCSSMGQRTQQKAKNLLSDVMVNLEEGNYSIEQMRPVYGKILSVAAHWRVKKTRTNGRVEQDARLREICRYLYKLEKEKNFKGDKVARNMDGEFRERLKEMRENILNAVDPFAADETPVPQNRNDKAIGVVVGAAPIFEEKPPVKSDSEAQGEKPKAEKKPNPEATKPPSKSRPDSPSESKK